MAPAGSGPPVVVPGAPRTLDRPRTLLSRNVRGRQPIGGEWYSCATTKWSSSSSRASTSEPCSPSLETFLNVIRNDGGTVENVDVWGRRRLAYEIKKHGEGIYAVLDVNCEPAAIKEIDRQLNLNESVLRTKVMRRDPVAAASRRGKAGAA